jgi:hypothetical protein
MLVKHIIKNPTCFGHNCLTIFRGPSFVLSAVTTSLLVCVVRLFIWYDIIIKQNYFQNSDKIIIQTDGLAMGTQSSSILSEMFLQQIEHTHLPYLTQKHKPVNYFRYIDDILLIFDSQHTDIQAITNDFNSINPNLHFTEETEQNNSINYLDVTIHKTLMNVNNSTLSK